MPESFAQPTEPFNASPVAQTAVPSASRTARERVRLRCSGTFPIAMRF